MNTTFSQDKDSESPKQKICFELFLKSIGSKYPVNSECLGKVCSKWDSEYNECCDLAKVLQLRKGR